MYTPKIFKTSSPDGSVKIKVAFDGEDYSVVFKKAEDAENAFDALHQYKNLLKVGCEGVWFKLSEKSPVVSVGDSDNRYTGSNYLFSDDFVADDVYRLFEVFDSLCSDDSEPF